MKLQLNDNYPREMRMYVTNRVECGARLILMDADIKKEQYHAYLIDDGNLLVVHGYLDYGYEIKYALRVVVIPHPERLAAALLNLNAPDSEEEDADEMSFDEAEAFLAEHGEYDGDYESTK
ncbi:hypothetical protein TAMA11512_13080 [Selenomonas sp. TAMA-11512]|uniref:hypothetical protein n=1 Tax=Selenomonas sp. TAMA-11512 TaxID=3095337 RepID=UPI00308F8EC1|nr:hypothetical protein TAMA11512_13080 [Selenomonas sp. TAMA-11512]